jgi:hypothetical protein
MRSDAGSEPESNAIDMLRLMILVTMVGIAAVLMQAGADVPRIHQHDPVVWAKAVASNRKV